MRWSRCVAPRDQKELGAFHKDPTVAACQSWEFKFSTFKFLAQSSSHPPLCLKVTPQLVHRSSETLGEHGSPSRLTSKTHQINYLSETRSEASVAAESQHTRWRPSEQEIRTIHSYLHTLQSIITSHPRASSPAVSLTLSRLSTALADAGEVRTHSDLYLHLPIDGFMASHVIDPSCCSLRCLLHYWSWLTFFFPCSTSKRAENHLQSRRYRSIRNRWGLGMATPNTLNGMLRKGSWHK